MTTRDRYSWFAIGERTSACARVSAHSILPIPNLIGTAPFVLRVGLFAALLCASASVALCQDYKLGALVLHDTNKSTHFTFSATLDPGATKKLVVTTAAANEQAIVDSLTWTIPSTVTRTELANSKVSLAIDTKNATKKKVVNEVSFVVTEEANAWRLTYDLYECIKGRLNASLTLQLRKVTSDANESDVAVTLRSDNATLPTCKVDLTDRATKTITASPLLGYGVRTSRHTSVDYQSIVIQVRVRLENPGPQDLPKATINIFDRQGTFVVSAAMARELYKNDFAYLGISTISNSVIRLVKWDTVVDPPNEAVFEARSINSNGQLIYIPWTRRIADFENRTGSDVTVRVLREPDLDPSNHQDVLVPANKMTHAIIGVKRVPDDEADLKMIEKRLDLANVHPRTGTPPAVGSSSRERLSEVILYHEKVDRQKFDRVKGFHSTILRTIKDRADLEADKANAEAARDALQQLGGQGPQVDRLRERIEVIENQIKANKQKEHKQRVALIGDLFK